jgi:hypothetical protein
VAWRTIIGVAGKAMTTTLQLLVEFVEQDIAQQR